MSTTFRVRLKHRPEQHTRRGSIAVLTALLMVPLIGMLAFSVDIGYLLKKRAELQRAADAAALAAVRDLVPDTNGHQNLDKVRTTLRTYAAQNVSDVSGFEVLDSDITIGRFDPETVYSGFAILNDGMLDTVRVTLRRDASANSPVQLFFGGIFGIVRSDVSATATAILQKASVIRPGAGVLPFSVPNADWNAAQAGDTWSIYGDGRMTNATGSQVPGNWGTLNLGPSSNSTDAINDQILNGLQQSHLDALYAQGRIPSKGSIESQLHFSANADPGLSAGMKSSLAAINGQVRLIPLYNSTSGKAGNNLEFKVTGWGVVVLTESNFQGSKNSYVKIQKSHTYDGTLRPNRDLSVTEGVIEGAFTSPVLVQ